MKDSQLEKLNVKELLDLRERLDDMGMSRSDVETVRSGTFRAW